MRRDITLEYLKAILHYDPHTGIFRWKISRNSYGGKAKPGAVAGTVAKEKDGYTRTQIGIDGVVYRAHILAWFYMTGAWPSSGTDVDHKNRCGTDNSWGNLRLATRSQNNVNSKIRSDNTSGVKGVSFSRERNKWVATIKAGGKLKMLGRFANKEDAISVRRAAEHETFGEFLPQ